jgi:FkbM family methyltransferase
MMNDLKKRVERLPLARILRRLKLLSYFNFHENISLDRQKIAIPLKAGVGVQHAWFPDEAMLNIYRQLLAYSSGEFIDVGANIGQTLLKIRTLDAQRRYIGFEPNPICVDYLVTLIKANNFLNCDIVPVGLSNSNGVVRLFLNDDTDSAATLIEGFRPDTPSTLANYISIFRLDDIAESLGIRNVAVIKIDVEGSELEVLKGAMNLLKTERPFIVCEILPLYDESSKAGAARAPRQRELLSLLRGLDYSVARIQHADATLVVIEDIEVHSNLGLCDYVFSPKEKSF